MQRYDKFPNRPNFSATFLHKNTKKTEGMTSVKGKGEGSFYNICAGAHEGGEGRPGGEAPGTAAEGRARRRRDGGTAERRGRAGTEAEGRRRKGNGHGGREKNTGEKGKRHWATGKKVLGCMIRAPARNDKGGRPY